MDTVQLFKRRAREWPYCCGKHMHVELAAPMDDHLCPGLIRMQCSICYRYDYFYAQDGRRVSLSEPAEP